MDLQSFVNDVHDIARRRPGKPGMSIAAALHPEEGNRMGPARAALAVAFACAVSAAASAEGVSVHTSPGVTWVSGGASAAERRELEAAASRFDLLVTVESDDGPYLGPSSIRIEREDGALVLATPTRGPVFLARLAPGGYRVHVQESGQSGTQAVEVKKGGLAEVRFLFRWEKEDHRG
jgi:hypothetical protein